MAKPKRSRLSEEERNEMYRLWRIELKGMAELAKRFGVAIPTVNGIITKEDEENLSKKRECRKLVDAELEKIRTIKSNTGIDSSDEELKEARRQERICVDKIKEIDPEFFVIIKADTEDS